MGRRLTAPPDVWQAGSTSTPSSVLINTYDARWAEGMGLPGANQQRTQCVEVGGVLAEGLALLYFCMVLCGALHRICPFLISINFCHLQK